MIVLLVLLTIISLCLLFWQISNLVSAIFGSPCVMMDKNTIRQALKLADLKKGEIFHDLGCGRGDVLIEAAKLGAKATGFEISPYYYIYAKIKVWRYRNIKVRYRNINSADLSRADVVYCYLLPKMLNKLSFKFRGELQRRTRLLSIGFPINHLGRPKTFRLASHKIYLYKL